MRTVFTTVAIILSAVTTYAQPHSFCEASAFSLAPAEVQVRVEEFGLSIGSEGTHSHLVLVNQATKPITRILILAEVLDPKGQYLVTLPFYAAMRNQWSNDYPPFPVPAAKNMEDALAPGEFVGLAADVNESTAQCPVRVQVAIVDMKFADGNRFHYSARGWQIEPSIANAKALQISSFPGPLPFEDLVDVAIDGKGRVMKVESHHSDPRIVDWFQAQLSAWSFAPKMRNGSSVPSAVRLLFRIHKLYDLHDPTPFDESAFQSGPLIAIDVFPKGEVSQNEQFISVGGIPLVVPH